MPQAPDWMPDEELEALTNAPKTTAASIAADEQLAMQVFRDHLPLAAQVICELATSAEKDQIRLSAAKYVVERVLGRTGEARADSVADTMWGKLFGSVIREPTAEERAAGTKVSRL